MNPRLKRGDVGAAVRQMQLIIARRSLGVRLKPDGRFGPRTEAEVQAFQRRSGLADGGGVGPAT
jgi:L,D-transpeptidase ErfK/SrfK